jgi:prepilin-type N-terminal cleavage/methylation domain-containing protein
MRNDNKSRRGFSLVELMIVISIIGILVAIGIPAWQSSVRATNEAAAITHLQRISTAQVTYFNTKNRSGYGTFDQLAGGNYLSKQFAGETPIVDGYVYKMGLIAKSGNEPPGFTVNADPQKPTGITATGSRFFYASSDTGITSNSEKPAGPDDPAAGGGQ